MLHRHAVFPRSRVFFSREREIIECVWNDIRKRMYKHTLYVEHVKVERANVEHVNIVKGDLYSFSKIYLFREMKNKNR